MIHASFNVTTLAHGVGGGSRRLAALVASPALAARVCIDSYGGGCLASTTCWHFDQHGNWIGTVRIDYGC